ADARTTVAAAVVVPYRSSLLFNPNPALAIDFGNAARLGDVNSKPFSQALVDSVTHAIFNSDDHLSTHGLMIANRFDKLDWLVCVPLLRPAGAKLDASWRFTARIVVTIGATKIDSAGCVRFTATMDAAYTPLALP